MTPYEAGRLARQQGCYRVLCVGTDEERAEWLRGYDEAGSVTLSDGRVLPADNH